MWPWCILILKFPVFSPERKISSNYPCLPCAAGTLTLCDQWLKKLNLGGDLSLFIFCKSYLYQNNSLHSWYSPKLLDSSQNIYHIYYYTDSQYAFLSLKKQVTHKGWEYNLTLLSQVTVLVVHIKGWQGTEVVMLYQVKIINLCKKI